MLFAIAIMTSPAGCLASLTSIRSMTCLKRLSTTVLTNRVIAGSAQVSPKAVVGPFVAIGERARVGDGTVIHNFAVIGDDVTIGSDCVVGEGVTVKNAEVGNRVSLKPGSRIGQDGFGYHPAGVAGKDVVKKPQNLRVIIEDDVEIGANCTVDRGSWRDTRIGAHTKLDNLVQIGHNVHIGRSCLIAAQTGIAGSATLGDRVLMGGQSGVAQYVKIGDDCQIAAKSGVTKSLPPKSKVGGVPAVPIIQFHRSVLMMQKYLSSIGSANNLTK